MALAARLPAAACGAEFATLCARAAPAGAAGFPQAPASGRREIGGVYPHLALFNNGNECGTGAVVAWAGRLFVVTYSPHQPFGSDDKVYEIDAQLNLTVRPESIGGTPANRMVHRESRQLFIGPYAISESGAVRTIPYDRMPGRPTGNARHLSSPAETIYAATMEEGLYEVDVRTLAVRQLYEDANAAYRRKAAKDIAGPLLPGYHGKGLYSGQGRLVYSNNGEYGGEGMPPSAPSGCLAEWDGREWRVVRRNQFTEVTGPGGLYGNDDPDRDPVWSIGWDHRSLILMILDGGAWHSYRLPKASHTYDGAHGWNTEWPRIREIGEPDLLMTMHGMFWRFPRRFSAVRSAGIAPRSTYLRIVADFERWGNRVVFGSDDAARSEFTNTRRVKGKVAPPGQSQSNLWFVEPSRLDRLGPPIGRGGVWVQEDVRGGVPSEPFLFDGFDQRMVHLAHESESEVTFSFEVDRGGAGKWTALRAVAVPARGYVPVIFGASERAAWVRITADRDCRRVTALFHYSTAVEAASGPSEPAAIFDGLAHPGSPALEGGLVWARDGGAGTLLYLTPAGLYELDATLALTPLLGPGAPRLDGRQPPASGRRARRRRCVHRLHGRRRTAMAAAAWWPRRRRDGISCACGPRGHDRTRPAQRRRDLLRAAVQQRGRHRDGAPRRDAQPRRPGLLLVARPAGPERGSREDDREQPDRALRRMERRRCGSGSSTISGNLHGREATAVRGRTRASARGSRRTPT